jgi:hypothetical protein
MPDEYNPARRQYATDKSIEEAFLESRNILASRSEGQVFDPHLLQSRLTGMSQCQPDKFGRDRQIRIWVQRGAWRR